MGRLVAAILYGALTWYVSTLIIPLFPEGMAAGRFAEVNALLALPVAWRIAGSRAGDGWGAALSYGLTTAIAITVVCLFFQCFGEMIRKSLDKRYDGPVEAVTDVFQLMVEFGQIMFDPMVLGTLLIGGLVAALVVEATGRSFR